MLVQSESLGQLDSMRQRLTQEFVDELPIDGRDRLIFDSLVAGFGVRVTPAGTKIFIAQARVKGRLCRVSLGRFPGKKLAEARDEARIALQELRAGRDPKLEQAARLRAIEAGATTVSAFADRGLDEHVRPQPKPRPVA